MISHRSSLKNGSYWRKTPSSPSHQVYTCPFVCISLSPSFLFLGSKKSPYQRPAPPVCTSKGVFFFISALSPSSVSLSLRFILMCCMIPHLPASFIVKRLQSIVYTYCLHFFIYKLLFSCFNLAYGTALPKFLFNLYHPKHNMLFSGLILVFRSFLAQLTPPSLMKHSSFLVL